MDVWIVMTRYDEGYTGDVQVFSSIFNAYVFLINMITDESEAYFSYDETEDGYYHRMYARIFDELYKFSIEQPDIFTVKGFEEEFVIRKMKMNPAYNFD